MLKVVSQLVLGIVMVASTALPALAATALREQEVIDLVTTEVVKRLQVSRRDVQVVWQDMDASNMVPALPEGRLTLEVSPNAHLGGRAAIPVQILIDGKRFRTIFPRLDVQIFQTVLVARAPIQRGAIVGSTDFGTQRAAVSTMNQPPLTNPNTVLGSEATRNIPAGTVFTASMFKLPVVVKVGDIVSIVLTSGDLTIIYQGQARMAGAMGQMIKVVNLESKREIAARVVGPNKVEIRED